MATCLGVFRVHSDGLVGWWGLCGAGHRVAGAWARTETARAASAAADVAGGGAPPSEELLAQLTAAAQEFYALRDDVLETATSFEVILPKPADTVVSLRDLVPVVDAL